MKRKIIKYVGFYDVTNSISDRVCNLAATNKMNYIADTLIEAGYEVQHISPSWMGDQTKVSFEMQNTLRIGKYKSVTYCPSWRTSNKVTRNIKIIVALTWLFLYLLFNTSKDEKIIAYHVQWISIPIRMAKFFKRFELVLEVEEVYQDVMMFKDYFVRWENALLKKADSYLYSTDLLKKKLASPKPSVVVYGEYKNYEKISLPISDNRIHLIYAGIIDEHKKGAFNALEASRFLSEKYVLHIVGFGEVEKLTNLIKKYNQTNKCKVQYDGLKSGKEYIEYCQSCHIGLSTQTMSGKYLESSFPSKILSYLSLGLRVVSGEIRCVTESQLSDVITFYKDDDPESIAKAIQDIDISKFFDSSEVIKKLHIEFLRSLKRLMED